MSQPIQPSLPCTSHNNQSLFSDYYLDNILPQQWNSLKDEAESVMKQLQKIYASFTPNPNNEAQTEDDWIKPVLRELGHRAYDVQVPLKVAKGTQTPDYIFYKDEFARNANKGKVVSDTDLEHNAYAIGDAKKWDRSLDKSSKDSKDSDLLNNKNPSYQIFFYMLQSGLPWGILTNGRHWRLYHHLTAHKLEVFYEINLPYLLDTNDAEEFLYFYLFFRRKAFDEGLLSLDRVLTASKEYAQNVSDDLREQVYDALRYVAQGFLDYPDNNLDSSPETCKQIYDNSLTLLYRLLFIFYAEARELLPLQNNSSYRDQYSLYSIKRDIANGSYEGLLPDSGIVWPRLKTLFDIINRGNPPLSVTTFNGGLFDPHKHIFLNRHTVGDLNLCRAIDKLARVNLQFVDYRDLAIRHLGTIYEGLLEYKLQVATELMVEQKSSGKIVPADGIAKKDRAAEFQAGEVYLVTAQGARKVTGSYYTPDYIVKYMVEQTLDPLLNDAVFGAITDADRINAVLGINVLDPSMGSGHFPVEVVEYLARFLVGLDVRPEETNEADIVYWKRKVAQQCIYGVDLNPLAVELAKLSLWLATAANDRPLSFLDHHLRVGNTLIGSWLNEIAANEYLGANQKKKRLKSAQEKEREAGQLSLLGDDDFKQNTSIALNSISSIEKNPAISIKDVKEQEAAYEEQRKRFSEKYRRLADLGAGMYFNLGVDNKLWRPLADYALGKTIILPPQFERFRDQVSHIANEKRFFHWELEFPAIFFDQEGNPLGENAGFDVVIGNPPYVRQEQLGPDKPYFKEHYSVYHGVADLFVYFFAQGIKLLCSKGRLAYISSNAWLRSNYATPLRQFLRTETTIETIIDLGDNRIFIDAPDLTPSIQIVCKKKPSNGSTAQVAVFARGEGIHSFKDQLINKLIKVSMHNQADTGWQLTDDNPRQLFARIMASGKPLEDVVNGRMYRGVLTGLNDAFIISKEIKEILVNADPKCASIIKPILRGEDLRPWYQENEERWLIFTRRGTSIENYPAIFTYLQQFQNQLEPRPNDWDNSLTWLGRKSGSYKWYEIQDTVEYYEEFEHSKIFWSPIGKFPRFSWDEQGLYVNNAGFFLIPTDISLLGILQSRISWFCITQLCTPLGERAGLIRYQQFMQFIIRLPIPDLTEDQRQTIGDLARQLTAVARQRYKLRRETAHRIQQDLGSPQGKFNKRLASWWELSFKEFRDEIIKVFGHDIRLKERNDWEEFLQDRRSEIAGLTNKIIELETELNSAVSAVFDLNTDDIKLIEQETKYSYGEW